MVIMQSYIIYTGLLLNVQCIWPPEYKVDLKYQEEFVISELLDRSDVEDIYDEEEMIQKEDLKTLKLHENSEKYFRLHKQVKRENVEIGENMELVVSKNNNNPQMLFPEFNAEENEDKPFIGGIVDVKHGLKKDENMIYFDDEAKSNKTNSDKLQKRNATSNIDYNYENLKEQYDKEVKMAETKNDTLKYKEIKEEESPKEAVKTLADFTPRNCTEEENTGIGFAAVKCFWMETHNKKLNKNNKIYILKKILIIFTLWVFIYLAIALPLWCQYGWCCCCCRCKFCQPRNEIEEIKTFFANNPPGVYHDENGILKKYKPTTYEIYAQKKLKQEIQRL